VGFTAITGRGFGRGFGVGETGAASVSAVGCNSITVGTCSDVEVEEEIEGDGGAAIDSTSSLILSSKTSEPTPSEEGSLYSREH
jgi:hypothetical protein